MMEILLKELQDTWGYTTEELNDIRKKMQEWGDSCYLLGVTNNKLFDSYGKKEDWSE